MNNLVIKIQLSETQITNENFLEKNEKVLKSFYNNEESDDEAVKNFNEKKNFELMQILKKALKLLTSSFSESVLYVQLSVKSNDQDQEQFLCEICF